MILIEGDHACFAQRFQAVLFMAHDTRGPGLFCVTKEALQAEVEYVVTGHHRTVLVNVQLLHRVPDVPHRAKPRLVRLGVVIEDSDLLRLALGPLEEMRGKAVIRDDHELLDQWGSTCRQPCSFIRRSCQFVRRPFGLRRCVRLSSLHSLCRLR